MGIEVFCPGEDLAVRLHARWYFTLLYFEDYANRHAEFLPPSTEEEFQGLGLVILNVVKDLIKYYQILRKRGSE